MPKLACSSVPPNDNDAPNMPIAKRPCLQCKEKHVRCDEERPKCRRCRSKNLPCSRPARKNVFRNSSATNFEGEQSWVAEAPTSKARGTEHLREPREHLIPPPGRAAPTPSLNLHRPLFPLQDPQEACLLRYFVEELSHWFDLCDEQRHFQLVVPRRARQYPPLLYSIFALAARHLTRLPKYQTPSGILYQGQLLPKLTKHDAFEYMLKCIPALREFHTIHDDESLESIIATAVILRQLEEIDDDEEADEASGRQHESRPHEQVNFLAIIDAVLRSPPSRSMFGRRSLIQAAYWMGVRQEIYHSFTRRHPPQMELDPEYGREASKANQIVIHTAQVAKWRWADASDEEEWLRLQNQAEQLENDVLQEFQPFFSRPANTANGEVFPTIWYSSFIEVTSIQLSIIAKMVLMAENPYLRAQTTSREQWRTVEKEVRRLLLELCGICICHPACPPALVHTAVGLELYGDFFADQYERHAVRGVVERLRSAHAWPVKKLSERFR